MIHCTRYKHIIWHTRMEKKEVSAKASIVINNGRLLPILSGRYSEVKTHQGVHQANMYQLYAYGTKYKECKRYVFNLS